MPYPAPFHRLVLIGSLYGDTFNTTLSIVPNFLTEWLPMTPVSDESLEDITDIVATWWARGLDGTGPGFISAARLTMVKLNRIGTDGRYMDGETKEFDLLAGVAGSANQTIAPQLSPVVSLDTARPRDRAGRGRMYFPPSLALGSLGTSDGRMTPTNAENLAKGAAALFRSINAHYTAVGAVGVASKAGAGGFQHVTQVRVGRVPDTVRSRRNKQIEDYQIEPM